MYQRKMELYTRGRSLRGWRAKRLLRQAGFRFDVIDTTEAPDGLSEAAHRDEVASPYVFVDQRPVGGLGTLRALASSGELEHLVRDDL